VDALHTHIQQPQDESRIKTGRTHDRGDPDSLGSHYHQLHITQIEAGVLHVDEGGVKAGEPDQLDDLRVWDTAHMGAEREPALA